jgi:hypothetical protein
MLTGSRMEMAAPARPAARWWWAAVAVALAVLGLVLAAPGATAAPPGQPPPNICPLLPPGGGELLPLEADRIALYPGWVAGCGALSYRDPSGPISVGVNLVQMDSAEQARTSALKTGFAPGEAREKRVSGIGDVAVEVTDPRVPESESRAFIISFARGCFMATVSVPPLAAVFSTAEKPVPQAHARALARQLDATLARQPPCSAAAPPAALAVGLACDQNRLQQEGNVTCAASVTGQRPDAQIAYEWTVDGRRAAATGNTLDVPGLAPGAHSVGVRARDSRNNVASNTESLSFTRGAAASGAPGGARGGTTGGAGSSAGGSGTSGTSGGGGGGRLLPPLVVGGAMAAAGAVIVLTRARSGRGQRQPPAGLRGPERATAVGSRPPQGSRPEQPADTAQRGAQSGADQTQPPQERRDDGSMPEIRVELLLEPSIRMQNLGQVGEIAVWGDDADFCYAGYRITVTTPGWRQTGMPVKATLLRDGQVVEGVGTVNTYTGPEVAHRWRVKAPWTNGDREPLRLQMTVSAECIHVQSSRVADATAPAAATLPVVGARPRLELVPDGPGNADGTYQVTVRPELTIFEQPYTGGLEVVRIDRPTEEFERFFYDPRPEEFWGPKVGDQYFRDPKAKQYRQGLTVRCKFHLNDEDMERIAETGAPVSFWVRPTGNGPGEEYIRTDADQVAVDHYRSCAQNLPAGGIEPHQPGLVELRPARVVFEFEPLSRDVLPNPDAPPDADYRTQLRLTVRSASGEPISGDDIRAGRHAGDPEALKTIQNWWLDFKTELPEKEPLLTWDPVKGVGARTHTAWADDVDGQGRITFANTPGGAADPFCEYDHWKLYWKPDVRYLAGQCCNVQISLHAADKDFDGPRIFIGPPCKFYVYADPADAELYGHAFPGLIDQKARDLRVGFFKEVDILSYDAVRGVIYLAQQALIPAVVSVKVLVGLAGLVGAPAAVLAGVRVFAAIAGFVPGLINVGAGVGLGKLRDDAGYQYTVCRVWDITREEYQRFWAAMRAWKRRSDQRELLYDSKMSLGDGNCVSFLESVCQANSFELPWKPPGMFSSPDAAMRRALSDPRYVARALESDPRHEKNTTGGTIVSHPWVYAPGVTPSRMPVDALGSWPPPVLPPSDNQGSNIPNGGRQPLDSPGSGAQSGNAPRSGEQAGNANAPHTGGPSANTNSNASSSAESNANSNTGNIPCGRCGFPMPTHARFCGRCGVALTR